MDRDSDLPGQHEVLANERVARVSEILGSVVMSGDFEAPWGEGEKPGADKIARALGLGSGPVAIAGTEIVPILTDAVRRQIEDAIDTNPPAYV